MPVGEHFAYMLRFDVDKKWKMSFTSQADQQQYFVLWKSIMLVLTLGLVTIQTLYMHEKLPNILDEKE